MTPPTTADNNIPLLSPAAQNQFAPSGTASPGYIEVANSPQQYYAYSPVQSQHSTAPTLEPISGQEYNLPLLLPAVQQNPVNPHGAGYIEVVDTSQPYHPYSPVQSHLSGVSSYDPKESVPLTYSAAGYREAPPPEKPFWKKYIVIIIVAVILIIGIIVGVAVYFATRPADNSSSGEFNVNSFSSPSQSALPSNSPPPTEPSPEPKPSIQPSPSPNPPPIPSPPPPAQSPRTSPVSSLRANGSSCTSSSQCVNYCGSGGTCGGY
ncbi:hypothetical protein HK098_007793, partial [Nowakowskiella sp. JEL0407]